ncbi:MAG: dolichyl-phosphate beta-glucosyltransferase [Chloroflexota bacterium]|nr:dolichyl-phosphate beta-glucosyltransferase [Chloroflexota bacterium]
MPSLFLSLVIPAYNEERRLPHTLEQVALFLESQSYSWEVIVVDNASSDKTPDIIRDFAQRHPQIRGLHEKRRGKGEAVKSGMLAAKGEYRFMCDADLSMPITELNRFLPPQLENFDLAIASREAQGATRHNEPFYRHLGGRAINTLIRLLILPGLNDTQCGFKCFSAAATEDLFNHQTLSSWSFDIEILAIAQLRGYKIAEIPISWHFEPGSKLNAFRSAVQMFLDILTVRDNARKGVYAKKD